MLIQTCFAKVFSHMNFVTRVNPRFPLSKMFFFPPSAQEKDEKRRRRRKRKIYLANGLCWIFTLFFQLIWNDNSGEWQMIFLLFHVPTTMPAATGKKGKESSANIWCLNILDCTSASQLRSLPILPVFLIVFQGFLIFPLFPSTLCKSSASCSDWRLPFSVSRYFFSPYHSRLNLHEPTSCACSARTLESSCDFIAFKLAITSMNSPVMEREW